MSTPYKVLYEGAIDKLKDYVFASMAEEDIYEILHDYIRPAVVNFSSCRQDLSLRDDDKEEFTADLTDSEIEILCNYMAVEYLDANYIRVPSILKPRMTTKEFNSFSPGNQLSELRKLREMYSDENKNRETAYSYKNSPMFEVE